MKMTLRLMLLLILVLSLTGCWKQPEPTIITKLVEVKQPIPNIPPKPKPDNYDMIKVRFNGEQYWAMTLADGLIMESNWISYQAWAESNYKILIKLKY